MKWMKRLIEVLNLKLLGQMGTDIGSIGKEQADAQLAGALTGYSRKGKYLYKPDGTRATP
jgi:hypothetical protein